MATFATTIPMAHALWREPQNFLNTEIPWMAISGVPLQEMFVGLKNPSLILAKSIGGAVRGVASDQVGYANRFLESEGFDICLPDAGSGYNNLYVAAVMKLLGHYKEKGEEGYWLSKVNKVAFRLPPTSVRHYNWQGQWVVEVPTKEGMSLMITAPTGVVGWDMIYEWAKIRSAMNPVRCDGGLISPMVRIGETGIDVSGLVGMSGGNWTIQEAVSAAKFRLGMYSFNFEAAAAYRASRSGSPRRRPEKSDYQADHGIHFAIFHTNPLPEGVHLLPLAAGDVPAEELSKTPVEE